MQLADGTHHYLARSHREVQSAQSILVKDAQRGLDSLSAAGHVVALRAVKKDTGAENYTSRLWSV